MDDEAGYQRHRWSRLGEVDILDRGTWPKFDNIARRDLVADHVEQFLMKAMGLVNFGNLVQVRLLGGDKA